MNDLGQERLSGNAVFCFSSKDTAISVPMSKSHAKAQLIAMLAFAVMYFGGVIAALYWPARIEGGGFMSVLLDADAYLACIVAGYLSAAVVRKQGIVIGASTGLMAAVLVGIYHFASGPSTNVPSDWHFWLASVLLGGLGGLVSHLRRAAGNLRRSQ